MKHSEIEQEFLRLNKLIGSLQNQTDHHFLPRLGFWEGSPKFSLADAIQAIADHLGMEFHLNPEIPKKLVLIKKPEEVRK